MALRWVVVSEMAGEIKGPLLRVAPTGPVKSAIELLARRETRANWLLGRRNRARSVVVEPCWSDSRFCISYA